MTDDRTPKILSRGAYRTLRTELELLKREGILAPETFERVAARYRTPSTDGADFGRLVFHATTALGVLALGFAAFLVLRFNWNYLSPTVKTAIAVGFLASAHIGAFAAKRCEKPVLSKLFMFGGSILFGVNVWQIAQIYQFNLNFPEGVWVWGVGVFLSAYFARLPILHYLAAGIFGVWVYSTATNGNFYNPNATTPFVFPDAAYSLPILAAFGYYWGVRRRIPSISILYLLLFSFWGVFQPIFWSAENSFMFYETFFGGVLWLFGSYVAKEETSAKTARILGAAFVLGFLIPTTYRDVYQYVSAQLATTTMTLYVGVLVFAVATLASALKKGTLKRDDWARLIFSPFGVAVAAIPAFVATSCVGMFGADAHQIQSLWALALSYYCDVLSIAVACFFIVTGAAGKPARYWLGTLYFVLWSILRYVDLFGNVGGVLAAALFFVGIAVFLFVAAFLFQTKIRRFVVESVPKPNVDDETNIAPNIELNLAAISPPTPNATVLKYGTCVAILFQFAAIFGVVAYQTASFVGAKTILVETAPIAPTDLFRGDYVVLNYPFSSPHGSVWEGGRSREIFDVTALDQTPNSGRVYIKLKLDPQDGVYKPLAMTIEKPKLADDEIALRGRRQHGNIRYGIEAFFLQEGTGREIENRNSRKKALVELLVADDGRARVRAVKLVDVAPVVEQETRLDAQKIDVSPVDLSERAGRAERANFPLKIEVVNGSDADVVLEKYRAIFVEIAENGENFKIHWDRSSLASFASPASELTLKPGEKATFEARVSQLGDVEVVDDLVPTSEIAPSPASNPNQNLSSPPETPR